MTSRTSRNSRANRTRTLVGLVTACALALSACTPLDPFARTPDGTTAGTGAGGIDAAEKRRQGLPIPAGSRFEAAGSVAPLLPQTDDIEGSLRPDDASAMARVPGVMARGRIIVGIDQSQNRLSFRDTVDGQLRGFEVDLAREIADDIFGDPDQVEFRYIYSADRANALQRREVDIIIQTLSITEDRQNVIQFSSPYLTSSTRMLVMRGSGIENYDDLRGRVACAADDSTSLELVRELAPEADILKVHRWSDCLMALQQRHVDAIISDDTILAGFADQDPFTTIVGEPVGQDSYGVGIRRGDDNNPNDLARRLVRQVNSTLERLRTDGTWDEMYNEWFAGSLANSQMPVPMYQDEDTEDQEDTDDTDDEDVTGDDE